MPSRTSNATYHTLLHDNGASECTCAAGRSGRACWHVTSLRAQEQRNHKAQGLRNFIRTYEGKLAIHPENLSRYAPLIATAKADLAALEGGVA
jgi:hypothetical protein